MPKKKTDPMTECQDCGMKQRISKVYPLPLLLNLSHRVLPGEEVPAGECPKCGALVHLVRMPKLVVISVKSGVAEVVRCPDGVRVQIKDLDVCP